MSAAVARMAGEETDEALAAAARAGDATAFSLLVGRYRDLAYAYALARLRSREEAEDAVQDAFLLAYRRIGQFRATGAWGAWMMRIVRNACHDRDRRRRKHEPIAEAWLDHAPTPEALALDESYRATLVRAVLALPESCRVPVVMHYWSRLTYRAIALALDLRESTVVGRVATGLRRLRREWAREELR